MSIKYKYAYQNNGEVIDINDIESEDRTLYAPYICVGCNKELSPRIGKIRRKYFAHKQTVNCSPESYLHQLAKLRFYKLYSEALLRKEPFILNINLKRNCTYGDKKLPDFKCDVKSVPEIDLTKYYPHIVLETKQGEFIPDLCLLSSKKDEVLFVEIAVTNKCKPEKINSGNKIIEIIIKSEEDIEELINSPIESTSKNVNIFNFKMELTDNFCSGDCYYFKKMFQAYSLRTIRQTYNYSFLVQTDGKVLLKEEVDLFDISDNVYKQEILMSDDDKGMIVKRCIAKALSSGVNVNNCYACVHAQKTFGYYPEIWCSEYRCNKNSDAAFNCTNYKLKEC